MCSSDILIVVGSELLAQICRDCEHTTAEECLYREYNRIAECRKIKRYFEGKMGAQMSVQREKSRYIASPGGEIIHLINAPVAVIERLEPKITLNMDRKFFKQCLVVDGLNKKIAEIDAGQEYVKKLRAEKEARDAH